MKKVVFQLALIALLLDIGKVIAQNTIFLTEGFETCNGTNKPAGWSEVRVSGAYYWRYQNGGGATTSTPEFKHPSVAHTGTRNALFQVEGTGPTSRLITPAMDLRFSIKPVLSFWLAQDVWDENTDELKVLYRTSITAPWVPLETYLATLLEWSKREIVLPPEAKTQNCQLAFEAKSNYGWGICIDDVLVDERGNVPRTVSSINTFQVNDNLPTGTESNPVAFIEVVVDGNTNNLYLTNANLTYTGTTISDITNFKLYYTRDSVFANATLIPLTATINVNTIQFAGGQQSLATGLNYIWVCANISASAAHGNTADISVPANSLTIGGNTFPSTLQSPSGNCKIEESIGTAYSFESLGGWTLNNSWAMGIPLGGGLNDPTTAYAGQKVMATNLNGNYPANITEGTAHRATINAINAKYYQNLYVRYKRWLNVESSDKARVWLSVDGGTTWSILMDNNGNTILDRYWKSISHDIGALATRKANVMVRFAIDESDVSFEYGGWNIDNFAITGDFIAKDLGVSGITSPTTHCGMGEELVTVKIKNYGGAPITAPFEVGFSIDNGVTYTKQLINPTIPVDGEYIHTFATTANLSTPGLKQLKFKTFLTGDEDTKNDIYSTNLYVFPSLNYKYINSFEITNGHWYPSGVNSTWAWGIVAKGTINKASDGTKVWTTGGLKSNYNNSELSYLESPCFNFATAEYPVFSFDYWANTENTVDGLRLDYSVDGGATWLPLTANINHNENWNTGTGVSALGTDGWTGNTASDYKTARTLLPITGPNSVLGKDNVKFRFVFASDGNNSLEGVAIDNIGIFELPYNVGVESLTSPVSGCLIGGGVNLIASIKNFGFRPLKVGLKVPIEIKLRNENIVKDTLLIGSIVNQNGSATFTSIGTYSIITKGSHSLRLNTNFAKELNRSNDTLKTTLNVLGIPSYSLGSDIAVPNPFPASISVELDAGINGLVPFNNYLWSTTETTRKITVTSYGTYSVTVTNENSCTATDAINVIESTNDIQILSATGLDNACLYPTPVHPQITIKNNGPSGVGPSFSMKNIPLSIMVDGVVMVSESFTPGTDIASGNSGVFTFTNTIAISTPKTYSIHIYSKINEDPNKNNDTLKITTQVWGTPIINFPQDTIVSFNATSIVLDAGSGFQSYAWRNSSVTTQTFNVPSLNSAWYYATVTAFNSCGTHTDSVYINAKDLSVISIQNPAPSFCDNENQSVAVVISNSGRDDFATNEKITIKYNTPEESVSKDFTLTTPLLAGNSRAFYFDNIIKLPEGEGFINVNAHIDNDPIANNNNLERSVEKRLSPTVSFDPSTISRVFGGSPFTVSPIYSNGVRSFAWKNPAWALLSNDSLYTIYDTPPGRSLNVIAYEGLSQIGCRDTATLTLVADDIAIDAIKTPTNQCELVNSTPVSITIENKGNFTYPSSTQFTVDVDVDGVHKFIENFNINSDLLAGGKRDISLTNTLGLLGKSNATIQATISTALDVVASNNIINKTVYATGYPSVNLGSNRIVHAWNDTLRTGSNYQTYEWFFNSSSSGTDSTFIATQTGTYKVNITDYNGCSGTSNEITLTFVVDDISLKTLDKPQTGCGLNPTEPVRVTVENTGSEIIPSGKLLTIGYKQYSLPNTVISAGTQNIPLTANLSAGQTRTFDLTGTMSFPSNNQYAVKTWVKMLGDLRVNNDTLNTTIQSFPPVLYSQFSVDTIETAKPDTILDAGGGFSSYLWSTSATTQTITATTAGKYWVEVTNSNGCKAKDSVYVKFLHDLSAESIITPVSPSCSLSSTQTITIRLKNVGLNNIPNGSSIQLKLKVASTLVATETLILSANLTIGSTLDYSFTYKPNLSAVGSYLLEVSAILKNDNVSGNNSAVKNVVVQGAPSPNLGVDRFISVNTILNPGAFVSYLWQDNSTNPTFTATQSGTYSVTVTDANGCTGYDEVVLTWQELSDIRVSALISPSTNCYKTQGYPVTATLTNKGSKTFTSGESINVSYQINSNSPVVETMSFSSSLAYNQSTNYTFTQKAILSPGVVSMVLKTIIGGINGVPSATYPITINANPTVDLGPDTIRRDDAFLLTATTSSGVTFLWSPGNSTNPSISIAAGAYGKYKLTVTSISTGCTAKDSVVVHWPVSIETIPGSNAKVTFFPNPVNDELAIKIETDKNEAFSIDLINPSGQIVKNLKTDITLFYNDKINVRGYTPGLYFLKVSNDKGSAVFKVIVQR